jgi:hypothetical protein
MAVAKDPWAGLRRPLLEGIDRDARAHSRAVWSLVVKFDAAPQGTVPRRRLPASFQADTRARQQRDSASQAADQFSPAPHDDPAHRQRLPVKPAGKTV